MLYPGSEAYSGTCKPYSSFDYMKRIKRFFFPKYDSCFQILNDTEGK